MDDVLDRRDVAQILDDPRFTVPEADAALPGPFGRFRARASRFANGPVHDGRRRAIERLLARLDPVELAADAASRTRAILRGNGVRVDIAAMSAVARTVPVACLAARLGFDRPDDLPGLVAEVAPAYASGVGTAAADAGVTRLLAAAPRTAQAVTDRDDDEACDLAVQLLVQAHAATAGLIDGAMRAAQAAPAGTATSDLLATTLRDDPPVRSTRRVAPDGTVRTLHLDGPDSDVVPGHPPRSLAFGAGARACPAQDLALAIAGAVVEELRAC
jgi:cytochrome P450